MARFPSEAWFGAVAAVYNSDDRYQGAGGGHCNCTAGLVVTGEDESVLEDVFVLTFEGAECKGGVAADEAALDEVDFYMHMPRADWREMLEDIQHHGHATENHTLNSLDLDRDDGLSTSRHGDQYREDLFFRYNQTLQFYFDASARVKTAFA